MATVAATKLVKPAGRLALASCGINAVHDEKKREFVHQQQQLLRFPTAVHRQDIFEVSREVFGHKQLGGAGAKGLLLADDEAGLLDAASPADKFLRVHENDEMNASLVQMGERLAQKPSVQEALREELRHWRMVDVPGGLSIPTLIDDPLPALEEPAVKPAAVTVAPVAAAVAAVEPSVGVARFVPLKHNGLPMIEHSVRDMHINALAVQQQRAAAAAYQQGASAAAAAAAAPDSGASLPTGAAEAEAEAHHADLAHRGDAKRGAVAAGAASAYADGADLLEEPDVVARGRGRTLSFVDRATKWLKQTLFGGRSGSGAAAAPAAPSFAAAGAVAAAGAAAGVAAAEEHVEHGEDAISEQVPVKSVAAAPAEEAKQERRDAQDDDAVAGVAAAAAADVDEADRAPRREQRQERHPADAMEQWLKAALGVAAALVALVVFKRHNPSLFKSVLAGLRA